MNKKGIKTSIVAIIAAVLVVSCFVFFFIGNIDKDSLTVAIAAVASGAAIIGNWFAKDADKSHTHD